MLEQLEIGKLMNFLVQGKEDGKLYLQPSSSTDAKETPLIKKTLEELNLPKNPAMQEVVDNFLQKHLPLAKEILLKVYQVSKEYEIPSKVITNLIDKQPFSPKEISVLSGLRANGIDHIVTDFKAVIQRLDNSKDLINVLNILKEHIPSEKVSTLLSQTINDTEKSNSQNGMPMKTFHPSDKVISELMPEKFLKQATLLTSNELLKFLNITVNKEMIGSPEEVLRKLIGKVYDTAMMVSPEAIKNDLGESEKIYNTYNLLTKLSKTLDKAEVSKEDKEYLNYIKEPLSILGKSNVEAEYFIFPLVHDNKQSQAELYFFKPKRTAKKNKTAMYIVLALSLPSINNIEIHINKQEKDIMLTINVEEEAVKKHIVQYIPKLNEQINGLGFTVNKVTCGLFKESSQKEFPQQDYSQYQLNHMDFKV
jgi:hypothetical protein